MKAVLRSSLPLPLRRISGFEAVGLLDRAGSYREAFDLAVEVHASTGGPCEIEDWTVALQEQCAMLRSKGRDWIKPRVDRVDGVAMVVAMPRSGTTLLEKMLDSHPQIGGIGEFDGLDAISRQLRRAPGWPRVPQAVPREILVEAQQIPQEYVRSTITTFADQRIQIISQTALARANLLDLIERYRLYPRLRSFETNDELVLRIRSAINVVPVTANSSGRGGEAVTIAFRVSFDYDEPVVTQRVAGELTTLYLNANVKQRQESTAETSSFVADESARLRAQVKGRAGCPAFSPAGRCAGLRWPPGWP
jgi:hypothetical protein